KIDMSYNNLGKLPLKFLKKISNNCIDFRASHNRLKNIPLSTIAEINGYVDVSFNEISSLENLAPKNQSKSR
ncbi:MAG: hypothetical protein MHPSP_002019, partial [Paramarteilia canceri]